MSNERTKRQLTQKVRHRSGLGPIWKKTAWGNLMTYGGRSYKLNVNVHFNKMSKTEL